jgi:hypothetical protein
MWFTSTGVEFDNEFKDKVYSVEEFFRSRIILPVNELAGNDWRVQFVAIPTVETSFIVDTSTRKPEHYDAIALLVIQALSEFKFSFFNRGPLM